MSERVALVTGGAGVIGQATVRVLAAAGARVSIFDRNGGDAAEALAQEAGGRLYTGDIADYDEVEAVITRLVADAGRVEIVVNCAGITRDARLWKMTPEMWREVLDVNLTGCWNVLRATAPHLRERGWGRIVNVASVLALRARPGLSNYVASKSGLLGLTRAAAVDFGYRGTTVNAVAPGLVESVLTAAMPEEQKAEIISRTPTGRLTTPEDVAAAIAFLCSEAAGQITGELIRVDGGLLA